MRPLELELANFRSYERERIDWRGHDLVVIAGDTGAGKTSLLDAICFALYGRTPEITGPGELLTIGRGSGEVRLTVQMAGGTWRLTRRFGKRAPQPQHLLERLVEDGGDVAETVVGKEPVDTRTRGLVGLTYEAFTSTVLLAQGQFARFFAAKGAERDEILREIFGVQSLEGVRAAALRFEAAHLARAEVLTFEAGSDAELGSVSVAARSARDLGARRGALRALTPSVAAWADRRRQASAAERAQLALQHAIDEMPSAPERSNAAAQAAAAAAALAERADARDRIRASREQCADELCAAEARLGTASDLAAVRSAAERHGTLANDLPAHRSGLERAHRALQQRVETLAESDADLAKTRAAHETLVEKSTVIGAIETALTNRDSVRAALVEVLRQRDVAADAARAADAHLVEMRDVHERSVRAEQAAHIRAGLHPGDDCPVCGAAVGFLPGLNAPDGETATDLRSAEEDATAAHRQLAARQGEVSRFEQSRAEGETAVDVARGLLPTSERDSRVTKHELDAQIATLSGAMVGPIAAAVAERDAVTREAGRIQEIAAQVERSSREMDELGALLEPHGGKDGVQAITASLLELERLGVRVVESDRALMRSESELAAAEKAVGFVEETLIRPIRLAAALTARSAGVDPPPAELSARSLAEACEALERGLAERAAAIEAERDDLRRRSDAELRWLSDRCAELGLAHPDDIPQTNERTLLDHASARSDFVRARDNALQIRRRLRDADDARAQAERFRTVALDLRADRFPRHLLARYRERLARAASERLQDLSRGAYRFAGAEPDPLAIVDTRRGEATRSVSTLSGGERFLASLSLALALGDIAAGAGGRLDCLFLDEGFSTLDADSLELAISGIERLSGGGRLIGVITHLPGVAERLGAAIRIVKDPSGVSRVEPEALVA